MPACKGLDVPATTWHDSSAFLDMLTVKYMLSGKHIRAVSYFVGDRRLRFKLTMPKKQKDPHAVYLGRLGGKARRRKLTAVQRREIAKKAAEARWSKYREKPSRGRTLMH